MKRLLFTCLFVCLAVNGWADVFPSYHKYPLYGQAVDANGDGKFESAKPYMVSATLKTGKYGYIRIGAKQYDISAAKPSITGDTYSMKYLCKHRENGKYELNYLVIFNMNMAERDKKDMMRIVVMNISTKASTVYFCKIEE